MQALYLLGFHPIEETLADHHSYGFRSGRSCADALEQCHNVLSNRRCARYVLEGDIKSCFDRISHAWLETHVPMDKVLLRQWLQASFLDKNVFFATTEGTPQGGILSPALANRALDGLQALLHERFGATATEQRRNKVHLVRYADDFIITGTSQEFLRNEVQPLVAHFLKERGLELSHEKISITHGEDGFDFLGQHIRRWTKPFRGRLWSWKDTRLFLRLSVTAQRAGDNGKTQIAFGQSWLLRGNRDRPRISIWCSDVCKPRNECIPQRVSSSSRRFVLRLRERRIFRKISVRILTHEAIYRFGAALIG